jgi:hypothetical protein
LAIAADDPGPAAVAACPEFPVPDEAADAPEPVAVVPALDKVFAFEEPFGPFAP